MPRKWLTKEKCLKLLEKEKYGRLATSDPDGRPYITPLNFIVLNEKIYFHCGFKGRKIKNIRANQKVCFEVSRIGKLYPAPNAKNFTFRFWSVLAEGFTREIQNPKFKLTVLNAIMKKYAAGYDFIPLSINDMPDVNVVEIAIEKISGKVSIDPAKQ